MCGGVLDALANGPCMGGVHAHNREPKKKPVTIIEKRKVSCSAMSCSSMLGHGHTFAIPCNADMHISYGIDA